MKANCHDCMAGVILERDGNVWRYPLHTVANVPGRRCPCSGQVAQAVER